MKYYKIKNSITKINNSVKQKVFLIAVALFTPSLLQLFPLGLNVGLTSCSAQITFVHITDLHVSNTISLVNSCDYNASEFQCYIKEFSNLSPKPDFVIASGDITNVGNESPDGMYPTFTKYLFPPSQTNPSNGAYFIDSAKTIPIYFTPGNHDYYTSLSVIPTSNAKLSYYPKYIAPDTDYVVTTDNAIIICMRSGYDGSYFDDADPSNPEGTGVSNSQCSWLRNVLKTNSSKRKIIVMHHPPVNANGTLYDGTAYTAILDTADGSLLNNRTHFLNICDSNQVDIVLAGHVHQNVVVNRKGTVVNENWSAGTRYVQTAAAFYGAYRIITINTSSVNVSTPLLSCTSTDVTEFSNLNNIIVYPNPAANNITIANSKQAIIYISNIQGQLIKTVTACDNNTTIDILAFAKGMYFIRVETNNRTIIKKFVKE